MRETVRAQCGFRLCVSATLTGALMLLSACASAPLAPTASLDAAKVAIANAEKADASQYAGAELSEAREKLVLANGAVKDESMILAERLAEQSRVEAELASARTATAKAVSVNEELSLGNDALIEEMQRAGDQQ
jgi:hypothetical protein